MAHPLKALFKCENGQHKLVSHQDRTNSEDSVQMTVASPWKEETGQSLSVPTQATHTNALFQLQLPV